jgi:hypothetical protein
MGKNDFICEMIKSLNMDQKLYENIENRRQTMISVYKKNGGIEKPREHTIYLMTFKGKYLTLIFDLHDIFTSYINLGLSASVKTEELLNNGIIDDPMQFDRIFPSNSYEDMDFRISHSECIKNNCNLDEFIDCKYFGVSEAEVTDSLYLLLCTAKQKLGLWLNNTVDSIMSDVLMYHCIEGLKPVSEGKLYE